DGRDCASPDQSLAAGPAAIRRRELLVPDHADSPGGVVVRSRIGRSFPTDARAKPVHPETGASSGASSRLIVREITLRNYRSYESLELELAPGLVLAVGENGVGKTNLLEALHVGTQGFSPRSR